MALSKSSKCIVGGVIVAGLLGICLWRSLREDYGIGVESVRWLPPEARNITYVRNGLLTIAEFDIEQGAFERWCAGRKTPVRKLGVDEGCDVPRCLSLLQKKGIIAVLPEPNAADPQAWSLWSEKRGNKSLGEGDLYYEDQRASGGGTVIGYDVEERRGYFSRDDH